MEKYHGKELKLTPLDLWCESCYVKFRRFVRSDKPYPTSFKCRDCDSEIIHFVVDTPFRARWLDFDKGNDLSKEDQKAFEKERKKRNIAEKKEKEQAEKAAQEAIKKKQKYLEDKKKYLEMDHIQAKLNAEKKEKETLETKTETSDSDSSADSSATEPVF